MPKKEKRNTNKGKRKNNIKFNKEFAVVKYFFVGLFLTIKRVLRCNPFGGSGVDLCEKKKDKGV